MGASERACGLPQKAGLHEVPVDILDVDDVKSLDSEEGIVSSISSESTNSSNEIAPDFLINSRSLISSVINTLNLYEDYNLLLLSGSGGRIDLEFLGKKSLIVPVDSIGDVLNYSLRQVSGEDQYKHGFLVKYSAVSISNESNSKVNICLLYTSDAADE